MKIMLMAGRLCHLADRWQRILAMLMFMIETMLEREAIMTTMEYRGAI